METLNLLIGKLNIHILIKIFALLCMPSLLLMYLIFIPITLPISILLCWNYKFQIKQQLKQQYQSVCNFMFYVLNYTLLFGCQYMLNEPLFELLRIIRESGLFIPPIVKMKRFIEVNLNFLLNLRLIQILIKLLNPFFQSIPNIITTNIIWKFVVQIYVNYLFPFYIWIRIDSFIKYANEKLVTIPIYDQIVIMFQNSIQNEPASSKLKIDQELDKFRIQLHQYAITQFWKNKTFKDFAILELQCGDAAGLSYIIETYGPQRCLGIDSSESQIQNNLKFFNYQNNLKFEIISPNELRSLHLPNKVNLIIGIEIKNKFAFTNVNMKSYMETAMNLLKEEGYLIISDFDTKQNLQQLENYLNIDGLQLIEKQDFTIGLAQAMQLQLDYIKQHESIKGNWISTFISKRLKPYEQKLQELKDRQKLYIVYILRKRSF